MISVRSSLCSGRFGSVRALQFLALLGFAACASSHGAKPLVVLEWPEPPQVTRIKHVRTIYNARDVEGPPTGWERFTNFLGTTVDEKQRGIAHAADTAVSADGQLVYVSDFAQGIVHVYDLATPEVRYFGLTSPMRNPFGITLDSAGNLYVVEQGAQQIRVMNPAGETLRMIQSNHLIRPTDIAVDEARGRIYVADPARQASKEHFVRVFDLEGNYLRDVGKGRGTGEGYLLFPTYVVLDGEGNLFVTDTMNSRVSIFSPDGEFLRTIGERGDGFGQFDKPKGVALDSLGNIYVTDSSWSNVQIFNPEGEVLLYFGGRGSYPGLLANPTGIAIARDTDTIYVTDYLNRRLCIYQLVNTDSVDDVPGKTDDALGAAAD